MDDERKCPNCNHKLEKNGHFVPPSFGDPGFFVCESICEECKEMKAAIY